MGESPNVAETANHKARRGGCMTNQCESGIGNCRCIRLVAGYMRCGNTTCEAIQIQTRRPQRKRTSISAVSANWEGPARFVGVKAAIPPSGNRSMRELPRRPVGGMRGRPYIVNREVA